MLDFTAKRRGPPPKAAKISGAVDPAPVHARFSAPHLVGCDDVDMLPGQRFVIAGSAANDGVFTVVANDADWYTVDREIKDEPPSMVTLRLVEAEA